MSPTIDPVTLVIYALLIMGGLALVLAVIIYLISKFFNVVEDPRKGQVEALLPGINCGACGFPGCSGMAVAFVEGVDRKDISGLICPPGGNETMAKIADSFGLKADAAVKEIAVLRCGGSCAASPAKAVYDGPHSCVISHTLFAGSGGCPSGCLHEGDCVTACQFEAMSLDPVSQLPLIDVSKCTACEACAKACPRNLIQMRPYGPDGKRVWVNCRNTEKGAVARKNCSVACIACNKCVKICDSIAKAISMENNLAYIDTQLCTACGACVAECPTGAIKEAME